MRQIRVTGKGKLQAVPDRIIVSVILKGTEKEYKKAIEQSKKASQVVKSVFIKLGFDSKDIKTKKFEIDTKYEREYDEKNRWKTIFEGYEYVHAMNVEFDKDNERLGQILYGLSQCEETPEISLQYTVSDAEKLKNDLLSKAVQDSKIKAEILAQASGVSLGKIVHIDYSWGELKVASSVMDDFLDCMKLSDEDCDEDFYDMDIEPEDIKLSDNVTVIWEIK